MVEIEAVSVGEAAHLQEQPPVELRESRERQRQRRRRVGGPSPHQLQVVARLVAILRHTWTDQGVDAWFHRSRLELGGRAPVDRLDDPQNERELLLIARAGRVQGGS
jgi:hypothetical protein